MEDQKKIILITGANGFIGGGLVSHLSGIPKFKVRASVRGDSYNFPSSIEVVPNFDLSKTINWGDTLKDVGCVIHCAARVHVMRDLSSDPLDEFRRINVEGTLELARQASKARVKRLIYISTIGVNGAQTFDTPYRANDKAAPHSAYAQSKYEAEVALRNFSVNSNMEVVIIRPPLVYGPNAPGNFKSLLRLMKRPIPLPLGSVGNKRSFVSLDNLVSLIVLCIDHPAAAHQIFLVSDDEDLSTADLLRRIGKEMNKHALLVPFPTSLLRLGANILGKSSMAQQLLGSLQVDITKTKELLNWKPPLSVEEGLKRLFKEA